MANTFWELKAISPSFFGHMRVCVRVYGCGRVWVGVGEYKNPLKVTLNHLIATAAAATDLGEFGCRRNVNCP